MSTILDALRKIEGERHGQNDQGRSRVLVYPPRPLSPPPPHRSLPWVAGVSFLLVGVAVGIWLTRQEEIPPEESGTLLPRLSKEAGLRLPPPPVPESFEAPEKTDSAVTGRQAQEEQQGTGRVPGPLTPEHPLALSEPPLLQDSPFASSPQVALRTSLVDATPRGFSEPGGEEARQKPEEPQRREDSAPHIEAQAGKAERSEHAQPLASGGPADRAQPDEAEEVYAAVPANSAISFLQWSPESARRKALVRVEGSPLTLVHEGDAVNGYTVVEIRPDAVALRSGVTRFQLRVR